jgi:hypothetical protein
MTAPASAPPPAPAGTPIVSDLGRLVRAPFSPGAVFAELRERPTVLWPWLLVSIAMMIVVYLGMPFQQRVMEIQAAGRPMPSWIGYIGMATVPIAIIALSALAAGIAYLVITGMGGETRFRSLLSVNLHASVLGLVQQAVTVGVLMMRGVDSIRTAADAKVSLGLDLLLPADAGLSPFLSGILGGIGPISLWGLVITAIGYEVAGKAGRGRAWTAAIVGFVIGLAVGAFFAGMGGGARGPE